MQTELDRDPARPPPIRWTPVHVRERLVEAFAIERRLPLARYGASGGRSTWPAMHHEFTDLIGWSDEARQAVWADWSRAKGAFPFEVSRMEEAFDWLPLLDDHIGERRCLAAWALLSARRQSLRRILQRKGWSRATFYRRVDSGAWRIADRLNAHGVAVR
jgi:hypothetical protein